MVLGYCARIDIVVEGLSSVAVLTAGVSTRTCHAQARGEVRHENDVVPTCYLPKISNA